ncbi:MAG: hypothetical protein K0R00_3179 [Herbinix sp.]|nr:hypothetical protein [Herbinix sp.]
MHEPIDTISLYGSDGLYPKYFEVDGITYTLGDVTEPKIEKFAGSTVLVFSCVVEVGGISRAVSLRYDLLLHQWLLSGGRDNNAFLYGSKNTKRKASYRT